MSVTILGGLETIFLYHFNGFGLGVFVSIIIFVIWRNNYHECKKVLEK